MFDFSNLIHNTFKSNFPITLVTKIGEYQNGLYAQTDKTEVTIEGSCTNMTGKDLKLLPENLRYEFSRQLFTTTEIPLDADIEYRGKRYKVILSEPYDDMSDSGHWKSILKLYSKGYNDAGQNTDRKPEPIDPITETPVTPPVLPSTPTGHYENGVWIDENSNT